MALGGGTFLVKNKVLPGAYINFVSKTRALGSMGERGVVGMLLRLNWGIENQVFEVFADEMLKNSQSIFGYPYTAPELLYLREVFQGAKSVKLFRPGGGTKAKCVSGNLTATAAYGGTRGNALQMVVESDVDDEELFYIRTLLDGQEVDVQAVSGIEALQPNAFVKFTGSGTPEPTAGVQLMGGTDKAPSGNDYSVFLDKIEAENVNTILYDGGDEITKGLFASFVKRLRDQEGIKLVAVLHDYAKADFEGVISVKNPATSGDNEAVLVYWVAGQSAGAEVNQSLTNKVYSGELDMKVDYKKSEFIKFLEAGEFVFYGDHGVQKVVRDINTFTSFIPTKNSDFANNQIIRVLDQIAVDTARIFDKYYLGKVQNNDTGRNLFKGELIAYHETMQSIQAITNFVADDILISKGVEKGDVIVDEAVEPVGAMEKLYMSVLVV